MLMVLLSEESAIKHYENMLIIHKLNLTAALKVCIFWHILEHEILKEATGYQKYYDKPGQLDWLKKNEENSYRNGEKTGEGFIPSEIVLDIENIRGYRNLAEHTGKIDDINYKKHFRTIIITINLLSNIPIPEDINNILNNKSIAIIIKKKNENNEIKNTKKLKKIKNRRGLTKGQVYTIINKHISCDLNASNTTYSTIIYKNKSSQVWWFEINS
jgi:hypothetical protein